MYSSDKQNELYKISKAWLNKPASPLEIDTLRDALRYHEWRYSIQNDPVLADYEYDQLFKQLEEIEGHHPELIKPDSPTQRVSSDLSEDFPAVEHMVPMLSLDNSYNGEDLRKFDEQVRKLAALSPHEQITYCLEPKFDGGSVAILYRNDQLVRAATRGNGTKGEDITLNIRTLSSVPLHAKFSEAGIAIAEIRGEAVIRKDKFEKLNKERAAKGLQVFANPRNSASGGLRMKVPSDTRDRQIEVFLFQMSYAIDEQGNDMLTELKAHENQINLLNRLGFKLEDPAELVCSDIEEVIKKVKSWEDKRETYAYEIDGMVVKVNDHSIQELCGYTQHHPKWAIAYKFKAKQATTTLLDVAFQVGKIGSITPVAKVEPTQLAGVTVSSISLHNEEFIKSKDLRIGDKIIIERAGDVIPYIVKSLPDLRDGSEQILNFPKHCPFDQSEKIELVRVEGEAAWRCPSCTCGQQNLQRMIFHVSKVAMDIDGFGKSYVERFFQEGLIKDISDIYNLDYEQIATFEGFGARSVEKLQKAIDIARKNPLSRLLYSLSIHHFGKKATKLIAQEIENIYELATWDEERFLSIKDIGPVVAKNVIEYFSQDEHIQMIQKMEEYGVNVHQTESDRPIKVAQDAPLLGKTILFTGSLQQMTRNEAKKLAELQGAKNISAVSTNLNILVVGEKAGSKLKKAKDIGTIEIMSEADFINLVS